MSDVIGNRDGVNDSIERALAILREVKAEDETSAIVVMPPDSGEFITGNHGGFVKLAIASLITAQGQDQSFVKAGWVIDYEMDWGVKGLKLDPLINPVQNKAKPPGFFLQLIQYLVFLGIAGIFIWGMRDLVMAIVHLIWRHN